MTDHDPHLEPQPPTIHELAEAMVDDDNSMVGWDDQYSAVAELMESEDIALLLLATMKGDRLTAMQIAAAYEDKVIECHVKLLEAAIERNKQ